jgi:hypothetical protein
MVTARINEHARVNRDLLNEVISEIFGRTLTHRRVTRTYDENGHLSAISTTDVTFTGDLQFGLDLDRKYIESGLVEVGDAVLYIHPTALTTLPEIGTQIVDGYSVWEIIDQIEAPELGGVVCHYSYRCKRAVNSTDSG